MTQKECEKSSRHAAAAAENTIKDAQKILSAAASVDIPLLKDLMSS